MKVPYMLVVGAKEQEAGLVAARRRDGTQVPPFGVSDFVKMLRDEDPTRSPKAGGRTS